METPRGSAAAIQEAIQLGNKISVKEMVKISEKVEAIGGAPLLPWNLTMTGAAPAFSG